MKYLFLVLLLATGCSTMSDYEQGCRDGVGYSTKFLPFVDYKSVGFSSREEQEQSFTNNLCNALEDSRLNRLDRFQRERGAGRRP